MRIVPIDDCLVVKRLPADEKTAGGILLPDAARERPQQGKVLSTGDGRWLKEGGRAPFQVREGDRVLFSPYSGTEIVVDGQELLILREGDVLAVVE